MQTITVPVEWLRPSALDEIIDSIKESFNPELAPVEVHTLLVELEDIRATM